MRDQKKRISIITSLHEEGQSQQSLRLEQPVVLVFSFPFITINSMYILS